MTVEKVSDTNPCPQTLVDKALWDETQAQLQAQAQLAQLNGRMYEETLERLHRAEADRSALTRIVGNCIAIMQRHILPDSAEPDAEFVNKIISEMDNAATIRAMSEGSVAYAPRAGATDVEMPGAWICDKCGYVLQKNVLHAGDGAVSADTNPLNQKCSNDGQLMRPLTWREANEELYQRAVKEIDARNKAEERCKAAQTLLNKFVAIRNRYCDGMPDSVFVREMIGLLNTVVSFQGSPTECTSDRVSQTGTAVPAGNAPVSADTGLLTRPTIDELEKILASGKEVPFEILPNGEIRAKEQTSASDLGVKKPLTMRENLGGEYSTYVPRAELTKAKEELEAFKTEIAAAFRKHGLASGPTAIDRLVEEKQKAEAACAEKDAALKIALTFVHLLDDGKTWTKMMGVKEQLEHAISLDCGKGYQKVDLVELVGRFLRWPLPESVCSDRCATVFGLSQRVGTNLLTAEEARQMFEHVLGKEKE